MTDYTNLRKIVTGDIIVKCRFGTEIRRIPINQVPTYDELCLMMYRVFKKEITTPENIALKYMDNEGDMISLLDDIDITHAISISSLLKVTVYDKSVEDKLTKAAAQFTPNAEIRTSLVELRDKLNALIESFQKSDAHESAAVAKENANNKAARRLTPAELAEFLNDSNTEKNTEPTLNASIKELTTLSPKGASVPYYPPPTSQPISQQQSQLPQQQQQQQPQKTPQQQTQQHPQYAPPTTQQPQQQQQQQQHQQQHQHQHQLAQQQQQPQQVPVQQQQPIQQQPPQYIQTPSVSSGLPQQQQQPQQRPVSMQQYPSQGSQSTVPPSPFINGAPQQQYNNPTNYQPPNNNNNDPRLQRPGYYVPPPPSSMSTPQMPPQPYNVPPPPSARW